MPDDLILLLASPPALAGAAILAVALLARTGLLTTLHHRPALVLGVGALAGAAFRMTELPGAPPDAVREAARFGLALLAFAGAQQCRLSRVARLSPAALRLTALSAPGLVIVSSAAIFALLPSLGLWSALLVAASFPLGVGAFDERAAMTAPLSGETKRAVRIDAALGIALGVPLAVMIEAASVAPPPGAAITELAGFELFAGAAVGGTIGLLAGRLVPVRDVPAPKAPFAALLVAYGAAWAMGFDAVMAGAACGILYAEEAPLAGPVRSRLFSVGTRQCVAPAFFALGAVMAPVVLQADLLVWLAALVPIVALRVVARSAALGGTDLPTPDKAFLSWFGGAPGAGAALFLVSLLGSPAAAAQPAALAVGALATAAALLTARIASGPLVTRQVRAAARARRTRYGAA